MRLVPHSPALLLGLALAVGGGAAMATTVYKSVDAEGRITFSDQPPPAEQLVEILDYDVPQARRSAEDTERLEQMRETTDRMAADRREREAARAKARSEAAAARAAPYPEYVAERYYYPGYPLLRRPVVRPPHRPPHGRPPHGKPPSLRPPVRPQPRLARRYSQHPANLIRRHYSSAAREQFYGSR